MKILITNDDGIHAEALPHLIRWARKLGDVTCVAPKIEQSGMSQALVNFIRPCEIRQVAIAPDITVWSMDATPADCVRFGVIGLQTDYDLIISGINRGYNLGDDIAYSGTVGAILEGARMGVKGIALSTSPDSLSAAIDQLDTVWGFLCRHDLLARAPLCNINIPDRKTPPNGFCFTRQGGMYYSDAFESRGPDTYIQVGAPVIPAEPDLSVDIDAIHAGYISVTPLTAQKTAFGVLDALRAETPTP